MRKASLRTFNGGLGLRALSPWLDRARTNLVTINYPGLHRPGMGVVLNSPRSERTPAWLHDKRLPTETSFFRFSITQGSNTVCLTQDYAGPMFFQLLTKRKLDLDPI